MRWWSKRCVNHLALPYDLGHDRGVAMPLITGCNRHKAFFPTFVEQTVNHRCDRVSPIFEAYDRTHTKIYSHRFLLFLGVIEQIGKGIYDSGFALVGRHYHNVGLRRHTFIHIGRGGCNRSHMRAMSVSRNIMSRRANQFRGIEYHTVSHRRSVSIPTALIPYMNNATIAPGIAKCRMHEIKTRINHPYQHALSRETAREIGKTYMKSIHMRIFPRKIGHGFYTVSGINILDIGIFGEIHQCAHRDYCRSQVTRHHIESHSIVRSKPVEVGLVAKSHYGMYILIGRPQDRCSLMNTGNRGSGELRRVIYRLKRLRRSHKGQRSRNHTYKFLSHYHKSMIL